MHAIYFKFWTFESWVLEQNILELRDILKKNTTHKSVYIANEKWIAANF